MTTNYAGDKPIQKERREIMLRLQQEMGVRVFADFLIDVFAQNGPNFSFTDLPALAVTWSVKRQQQAAAAAKEWSKRSPKALMLVGKDAS